MAAMPLPRATLAADYAVGADLSFLRQAESRGFVFKENNQPKPGLRIFRDHGYNWIRLRIFNDPAVLPNNLAYTLAMAKAAKEMGFKFLLDFHYSDTWADPTKQGIPKAWVEKSHMELARAVADYTRDTLLAFRDDDAMPDMVQIGNEITNGMLWPDGKLPENWDNFTDLLKAGIHGVEESVAQTRPSTMAWGNTQTDKAPPMMPRIMIHTDCGGDARANKSFFDKILAANIHFDVIGQSFYPWWHGSLLDLRENLKFLSKAYGKDIIVVETAYNWRPAEYRNRPGPFPETPEGQRRFLEEVNRIVMETPDGRGKGIFYWEPAVAAGRNGRGMFDNDGNALPALGALDAWTLGRVPRGSNAN